jgi:lysophospholipase L1-like esterase
MSCPADIVREATTPQGTDVHFDSPVPTGGRAPYSVQCLPGSGSVFPVGESTVRCTATDADMAQVACSVTVRVRVSQTLGRTKFLAFGDSITFGVVSLAPFIMLGPPDTYPFKLEQMLRQKFPTQPVVVTESGVPGEETREGARRVSSVLEATKPEVMLLLEGINNINALATATQVSGLRTMITEAQRRNVEVIIATVMPVSPTWRHYQPGNTPSKIQALNAQIFQLANQHGLGRVVDLFALFEANMHLLGADGLHPSIEGQTRIAQAFSDEIVRRYESRATMTSRLRSMSVNDAR